MLKLRPVPPLEQPARKTHVSHDFLSSTYVFIHRDAQSQEATPATGHVMGHTRSCSGQRSTSQWTYGWTEASLAPVQTESAAPAPLSQSAPHPTIWFGMSTDLSAKITVFQLFHLSSLGGSNVAALATWAKNSKQNDLTYLGARNYAGIKDFMVEEESPSLVTIHAESLLFIHSSGSL